MKILIIIRGINPKNFTKNGFDCFHNYLLPTKGKRFHNRSKIKIIKIILIGHKRIIHLSTLV